jgi:hypothetical protein
LNSLLLSILCLCLQIETNQIDATKENDVDLKSSKNENFQTTEIVSYSTYAPTTEPKEYPFTISAIQPSKPIVLEVFSF